MRAVLLSLCVILIVLISIGCEETAQSTASTEDTTVEPAVETNTPEPICSPTEFENSSPRSFSAIEFSDAVADLVERVESAVVFISSEIQADSFFFGTTTQESSGSGVIVSSDGYILTNNHVVEGAGSIEVSLPGVMASFEAEIVGIDPLTDLAVIKIRGDDFPTVPFGDASKLRPGNMVIAMGYPLALNQGATITLGVVSNVERSFTVGDSTYYDVIQTDAAINRGNSGGPLLDLNGSIVGINSVLFGGAQNIGFAIGTDTAMFVYEALISNSHRVVRPWLGIEMVTVTPDIAADVDLPKQSGAVIAHVVPDSPADLAGMEIKDVITRFNGKEVGSATQLIRDLWHKQVGDEVIITYWRDDDEKEVVIELTVERPS